MLMGKEEADAGTIKIGETVSMVGVGQERMEQLDDSKTVFEGNCFLRHYGLLTSIARNSS
jgi:ATPase subunit of ABC transporter with duplicated ATPase domains